MVRIHPKKWFDSNNIFVMFAYTDLQFFVYNFIPTRNILVYCSTPVNFNNLTSFTFIEKKSVIDEHKNSIRF